MPFLQHIMLLRQIRVAKTNALSNGIDGTKMVIFEGATG